MEKGTRKERASDLEERRGWRMRIRMELLKGEGLRAASHRYQGLLYR